MIGRKSGWPRPDGWGRAGLALAALLLAATGAEAQTRSTGPGAAASAWQYSEKSDAMRGTVKRSAMAASRNRVDFKFPYDGGSRAFLFLEGQPDGRIFVTFVVDKGQFQCERLSGTFSFRIDDGPVERLGCFTSPGSPAQMSLVTPERFAPRLEGASRLIVEASFFGEGARQFTFDVQGLELQRVDSRK